MKLRCGSYNDYRIQAGLPPLSSEMIEEIEEVGRDTRAGMAIVSVIVIVFLFTACCGVGYLFMLVTK